MEKVIYLAGGCFWGVEKYMGILAAVTHTEVGFANGHTKNPSYEDVYKGDTGYAETVKVTYTGSLDHVLEQFYKIIEPTTLNRQADDVGSHYRTGVYFTNPAEEAVIARSLKKLQEEYDKPIVTENLPLKNYYKADEYHQKYLDKNPEGYCHIPDYMYEEAGKS